jgi:predicted HAD superfamily Cof-like phosphohydrolase
VSELTDICKDMDRVAKRLARLSDRTNAEPTDFEAVGQFHRKFDLPTSGRGREPRELTPAEVDFRFKFLAEELLEIAEALGITCEIKWAPKPGAVQDVAKAFDGLLDLVYVALGTAHMGGWPWAEGFAEVQRANMSKERAAKDGSNSTRGSALDVVKPANFRPPNIIEVLMAAGWKGPRLPVGDEPGDPVGQDWRDFYTKEKAREEWLTLEPLTEIQRIFCECDEHKHGKTINNDPNYKCTKCGLMVPTL